MHQYSAKLASDNTNMLDFYRNLVKYPDDTLGLFSDTRPKSSGKAINTSHIMLDNLKYLAAKLLNS